MTQPIPAELKPSYRAWCSLLLQEWNKSSTWGRVVSQAQSKQLPLDQLPTTIDGFVSYKTPVRVVIAERFPALSRRLFDANDDTERGMVLLWLMQHPQQAEKLSKKHATPFVEVAKEVKKNAHIIQAADMTKHALKDATNAGGHVPVRGRQSSRRFPGH